MAKTIGALVGEENASKHKKAVAQNGVRETITKEPIALLNGNEAREFIKGKSVDEILAASGIQAKQSMDGTKILDKYHVPGVYKTYADYGVDEKSLLEGVSKILGNCNLRKSVIETLPVETIQGDLVIGAESKIKDLSAVKQLYGSVIMQAKDKTEAMELLKKMHFRPEKFLGKIITI